MKRMVRIVLSLCMILSAFSLDAHAEIHVRDNGEGSVAAQISETSHVSANEEVYSVAPLAAATVASGTCGNALNWTLNSSGVLTISGTGTMTHFTRAASAPWYAYAADIQSVVIQSGVTSVGPNAFAQSYKALTSVSLPSTITRIGYNAFYTSALTTVTIPNAVTEIEPTAFSYCTALQSVTFQNGSSLKTIAEDAFANCINLTSVTLPDGLETIGEYAFYKCTALPAIAFPDTVKSIGKYAFSACTQLSEITLPNSLTELGAYAFYNCSKLASVYVPASVEAIPDDCFRNCTGLKTVNLSEGLQTIKTYAFQNCRSLESIALPNSLISIDYQAFINCSGLKSFVFPDGITTVSGSVLSNCTALEEVVFPAQCTSIGGGALEGCSSLTEIILPDTVEELGSYVFAETGITELKLPAALEKIGEYAFRGTALTSIALPENVRTIDGRAFVGSQVAGITVEGSAPNYTFQNGVLCSADGQRCILFLEAYGDSCVVPDGIGIIGAYAFYGNSVSTLELPASVTTMEDYALYNNENLTEIIFHGSESEWGNLLVGYAVTLPETITCLGTDPVYPPDLGSQSNPVTTWDELQGAFNMASTDSTVVTEIYVSPSFSTEGDTVSEKSVTAMKRYIHLMGAGTDPSVILRPENVLTDMFRVYGGSFQMSNLILDGGSTESPVAGSIIGCGEYAKITVNQDVILQNNHASVNGGAIRAESGNNLYIYGTISNNSSTQLGGGVYQVSSGRLELLGTVTQNTATSGGGLYLASSMAYFNLNGQSGEITHNTAYEDGGGVYWKGNQFTGGKIQYNTAKRGGGMYLANSTATNKPGIIQYNSASERGGGIYMAYGAAITWSGTLSDNDCSSKTAENRDDLYIVGTASAITVNSTVPPSTYKCYFDLGMPSVVFAYHSTNAERWADFFISTDGCPILKADTFLYSASAPATSTLDANGGSWEEEVTKVITAGYAYKVSDMPAEPVREGYVFCEWNTSADGSGQVFDPNAQFAMQYTNGETFYAVWLEENHQHTFTNYKSDGNATCVTDGTKTAKCDNTVCDATDTLPDDGSAPGHTEVIDGAVEAACTETGLTEGKHCAVCNEVLVAQTVVEARGHTEVVDEAMAPACTETGLTEGKHCAVCNEVLVAQIVVDAAGHSWTEANCLAPKTCTRCGITEGEPSQNHTGLIMLTSDGNGWLLADGAALSSTGNLPAGNYYLGDNITVAKTIKISSDVKICLNGMVLQYQSESPGPVFYVSSGALYICDCGTATHGYDRESTGLWVWNDEDGDYRLAGGAITGGTGYSSGQYGGAVFISSGTFELHGGNLVGNTAVNGGAIAGDKYYDHTVRICDSRMVGNVANGGDGGAVYTRGLGSSNGQYDELTTLVITDTLIDQNVAEDGGAIAGGGNVALEGCVLRKNSASYAGGAVYMTAGSLALTDCTVAENTAARNGGGMHVAASLTGSGLVYIYDNACTAADGTLNLYVNSNNVITLAGALAGESRIGIRLPSSRVFTSGGGDVYRACFVSEDAAYHIAASEGELCFEAHTEETVPAVSATCTESGLTAGAKCSVCDKVLLAQTEVAAPGHTEVTDAAVAATCTATGLTEGSHCAGCGVTIVAPSIVPMTEHTWENLSGVFMQKCTACQVTREVDTVTGQEGTVTWTLTKDGMLTFSGEGVITEMDAIAPFADSIKHMVIESGVSGVQPGAFGSYSALESFTVSADNPSLSSRDGVLFGTEDAVNPVNLFVAANDLSARGMTQLLAYPMGRTNTSYTVPGTNVAPFAFAGNPYLTSVSFEGNTEQIAQGAFSGCTALEEASLPASLQTIGVDAFKDCPLSRVVYAGAPEDWAQVEMGSGDAASNPIQKAEPVYYTVAAQWDPTHSVLHIIGLPADAEQIFVAFVSPTGQMVKFVICTPQQIMEGIDISCEDISPENCTANIMMIGKDYAPVVDRLPVN